MSSSLRTIGRRPAIVFYNLGTIVSGLYLFLGVTAWDLYPCLLPIFGYFVFGVFSGHAVYLPKLFTTQCAPPPFRSATAPAA
jgi:hypothetical protein